MGILAHKGWCATQPGWGGESTLCDCGVEITPVDGTQRLTLDQLEEVISARRARLNDTSAERFFQPHLTDVGVAPDAPTSVNPDDLSEDSSESLSSWWIDHAIDEARRTCAKMAEYGSSDLVALGRTYAHMAGIPAPAAVEAMEIGCLIYLLGKVNRAVESVRQHRPILLDTWFDTAVYAKMAQAARAGAWEVAE